MKTLSKALVATIATGAMAAASISPAYARHDGDGIGAGEIIAGALILGGIAAVAASASDNDRDYGRDYDRGYRGGDYSRSGYRGQNRYGYNQGNPRSAVEMCIRAAENTARRYSYGVAKVTDIREVDRDRDGFTVKGRIAVNSMGRSWRHGDRDYGRGWDNDYRGWNSRYRGYDSGKFTCDVRYGRVVDLDFRNIRGL